MGTDPALGLRRANYLRKKLAGDRFVPNRVLYHTMIKAFGRCGDLETALELVDEMEGHRHLVDRETMGHLLQGCVSDRESGFRHALLVWRRIRKRKIWMDVKLYNLMLRAGKECGLGSPGHTRCTDCLLFKFVFWALPKLR